MTEDNQETQNTNQEELEQEAPLLEEESSSSEPLAASDLEAVSQESEASDVDEDERSEDDRKVNIPEWGKKDPAAWGAYIARKTANEIEKKVEDRFKGEINSLKDKLSELSAPKKYNDDGEFEEENTRFFDPENPDLVLDATTPEGQAALAKFALKKKQEEHLLRKQQEEISHKIQEKKNKLRTSLESAVKKNPEIEKILVEAVETCSKPSYQIVDFVISMNNNQTDFLLYLARNKKEWHRIASLDPLSAQGELLRHHGEFNSRNRIGNTSPPVQSLSRPSRSGSVTKIADSVESAEEMIRAKYNRRG